VSGKDEFDAEAYLAAALPAMGLTIDPAWKPSVVANLKRNAEIARLFLEFPLDDAEEPAPTFAP
jgi:hypothetical protein